MKFVRWCLWAKKAMSTVVGGANLLPNVRLCGFCDVVLKRFLPSDVSVKCVQAYLSGKRVLFGLVIFNYWKTFAFLFASFLSKVFMEIDIWLIKIFRRNQGLIFLVSISGKRLHVALINSYKISVLVYFCIDFACADRK